MGRSAGQKEPIEKPDDEQEDFSTIEEFGDDKVTIPPSISARISSFLQRIDLDDSTATFYLHKYENYLSGESKAFIDKFEDCDPPDEYLIGKKYGSGRYLLTLVIPPVRGKHQGHTRVYRFRVHPSFDKGINDNRVMNYPVHLQQSSPGSEGINQAFQLLERMMSVFMPILNRPKDENVLDILNQNYRSVNEIMQRQMLDNVEMISRYQKNIADIGSEETMKTTETEEESETPSIIEQFYPLIQQWIPILLGGGAQAKAASTIAQQVPQIQQVLRDKVQLRRIIQYLDNTHGVEKTNKILSALRINNARVKTKQAPAKKGLNEKLVNQQVGNQTA